MHVAVAGLKNSCQKWVTLSLPKVHHLQLLPPLKSLYKVMDDCSTCYYLNSNSNVVTIKEGVVVLGRRF